MREIESRFARGSFRDLVREIVDSSDPRTREKLSPRDWAFLVGSLVFVGRWNDARQTADDELPARETEAWIIARFFLGVGASRDSRYAEARALFAKNLDVWSQGRLGPGLGFYVFQGFGFLRNLQSRFSKSALWAERAWRHAFKARDPFGMLFSADLRAHNDIQLGRIAKGLHGFGEAREIARRLGQESFLRALEVNVAIYRAQHGWSEDPEGELRSFLEDPHLSDTYSRSNLFCELARIQVARGRPRAALRTLEEGTDEIFRWGHRRQKAFYHSRRAHIFALAGDSSGAAQAITAGLELLEEDVDLVPRLELLGLRERLRPEEPGLRDEIRRLTSLSGRKISRRILERATGRTSAEGDDRLGALCDRVTARPESVEVVLDVVASGWLGVLRPLFGSAEPREVRLLLDLVPDRLAILDRGEVRISEEVVPGQIRALLLALGRGPQTKEELVESIWGYRYEALRHDPMVYTAIHRLRRVLGDFEDLLVVEGGLYRWGRPTRTHVFERQTLAPRVEGAELLPTATSRGPLNLRQLRILEEFPVQGSIDAETYAKKFGVSKPTAVRDLRELVESRRLQKVGRARATNYVRRDL